MKKRICLTLAVVLLVGMLAGCDSADYKQAQQLYTAGNYAEASAIFAQLGDYEDSAEMVTACAYGQAAALYENGSYAEAEDAFAALGSYKDSAEMVTACQYQTALGCYENGDYATALALFTQLGDYGDAGQYRLDAAWYALQDYIEENGESVDSTACLKRSDEDGFTCLGIVEGDPDQLILRSARTMDLGFYQSINDCTIVLTRGSSEAVYTLSDSSTTTVDGKSGHGASSASGVIDLTTATAELVPERSNYSYYMQDIYGNEITRDIPDAVDLTEAQDRYGFIVSQIPVILEQTGLGITIQDLGFVALG